MHYEAMNGYKLYTSCRFCGEKLNKPVINLGNVPLAGGFLKSRKDFSKEGIFPLTVAFCNNCYLLQIREVVSANTLFKNYFYHSSSIKTLLDHFENAAGEAKKILKNPKGSFVVEIGCNDGGFLRALQSHGFNVLGVDPATNIVRPLIRKGFPITNDFFGEIVGERIAKNHGQANAIYSFHSMAHIEDMHDVMRGVKKLLKKDGFLAFEVHYLGSLLKEYQYDMIYHEHQFYYSLLSLQNFFTQYKMEVFNVQSFSIRAGSMMYFIQNKKGGKRQISSRVGELLKQEKKEKLHRIETYQAFSEHIKKTRKDLLSLITNLKKNKKQIIGYGASGRGTVMMNYCNLDKQLLDYVVDDAPAKWGTYMPGTHQEIKNPKVLSGKKSPDYAVLFAWPFFKEIKARNKDFKGKFIIPLPKVKII